MNIEVGKYYIIDGNTVCICDYADSIVYAFSLVDSDDICSIFADEIDDYMIEEF